LQPIDQGEVCVLGKAIHLFTASQADRFRGRHVGFVYQNFNLINGFTALENVTIGMRFGRKVNSSHMKRQALTLLEKVGLQERIHFRVENLSVGERQRVAIARSLANEPDILLADEPTGSLDVTTAKEIVKLILDSAIEKNITLIFVTHDQGIAQRFPLQFLCQNFVEMIEETS
jgi:ABC-type lipoprotein export system ATPase subunit